MLLSTYTRNYFLPSLFNCKRTVPLSGNCRPHAGPALSFWLIAGKERVEFCFSIKEVIQPQVPLRLPCCDFTPIIGPTVDGCLYC